MPSLARFLPLVAFSVACAACDSSAPEATSTRAAPAPLPGPSSQALTAGTAATAPAASAAPPSTEETRALTQRNNAFALDLYAKARAQKGNLALSPFSLFTALATTSAGARGETAAQMRTVLHLEGPSDRVIDVAGALVAGYGAPNLTTTLRISNRLFGEKSYAFEPPFLSRIRAAFGAPLEPVDFTTDAENGRGHMNALVAQATRCHNADLIRTPRGVDAKTRLVLTSLVYFGGGTPFHAANTGPSPFSLTKTKAKPVPTMHKTERFGFAATDGVKLLELPYQNGPRNTGILAVLSGNVEFFGSVKPYGTLAMTLVLPDAVDGLDAVEGRLTPARLDSWLHELATTFVSVSLPKLEIDPTVSVADALASLGMPLAFDRGRADFTGIADPPSPADRLYITNVFHNACIRVEDTEAAAAAASATDVVAAPPEFKADHPFLFFLRDVRSGMILLMGRVNDPAAK